MDYRDELLTVVRHLRDKINDISQRNKYLEADVRMADEAIANAIKKIEKEQ